MLKIPMENNRLNLDQPLLSVRRSPSAATLPAKNRKNNYNSSLTGTAHLPYYKSELKSGPIRNPGVVPFRWEQMPGRPKDEATTQPKTLVEQPPPVPKLPPGRIFNHTPKPSDKATQDSALHMPKVDNSLPASSMSSVVKNACEVDVFKVEMEEENMSTAEDGDSTYADALDTLSRTESFVLNSTNSVVSGVDDFSLKPLANVTDPYARDFMMERFLPAAHAVASEMPQFAPRKQQVVKEETKLPKKTIKWDMQSTVYMHSTPDKKKEEVNGDDYSDESKGTDYPSAMGCGLFPRCFLLNPMPDMRDEAQISMSSRNRVHRMPASASSISRRQIHSKYAVKANGSAAYTQKPLAPACSSEMGFLAEENLKPKLNESTYQSDYRTSNESFKDLGLVPEGITSYRKTVSQSFFDEGKRFVDVREEAKVSLMHEHHATGNGFINSLNMVANQNSIDESESTHPAIEKTLYIDSLQMVEYQSSHSSSSESRWTTKSRRHAPSSDHALQDDKYVCCAEEKEASMPQGLENVNFAGLSSVKKSSHAVRNELKETREDQSPKLEPHFMAHLNLDGGKKLDMAARRNPTEDAKSTKRTILPLPLPKSPSDSWLSRTLPSTSSRNPYSRLHAGVAVRQRTWVNSKRGVMVECSELYKGNSGHTRDLATISED